ncbi:MAG TPA: FG-GAP-like repeat-containing protein [Candidatus Acidoferrales bacterium]|nr:FG-GAP-like repeat-containing protein [Candidatus Acidoferrales bacterium]
MWLVFAAAVASAYPQARSSTDSPSAVTVKPDARKAKEAFREGEAAEKQQDWATAYEYYSQAAEYAPSDKNYALRRETAKAALVQSHVDAAERDAISNRLDDARRELLIASNLDPTNTAIRERLAEFLAAEPSPKTTSAKLGGEPQLNYREGTQNFNYRGDTLGAYNEVARVFGVEASFDPDLSSRPVNLVLNDVDFPTAMRILGVMTDTFWRPTSGQMFFVAQDTPQKRREFAEVAIRTVLLPASATPAEMTETLRVVRDISGITRATLDTSSRTITLRASPQALAVASDVIDGIEQPLGQMILEIEVLEVDKNFARQLGITPPQHLRAFTLTPSEITEANSSAAGLVDVISKIFGLPTSLSGLSPTQIAGLLGSGDLNAASLIPPLVAFGGGQSTFLATMPSAVANFGRTLSLVHHGVRIFLRAEDGQPATAFFGEHYPVSLASYSSSLGGPQIPGISSSSFPSKNYQAGKAPQFIATAVLRNGSAISDLIVANAQSGNIGVLLGNGVTTGDGTFANQVTYATDPLNPASSPVWIASGSFDESNGFIDLAVANKASNNIGILLAGAAGDGTFQPATTIPTGRSPVSVVAARFHDLNASNNHVDLAVANQGDNTISIFAGKGDGTFATSATVLQLPVGFQPAGLLAEDLNGDNHIDLVVADQGNNSVSVFLGNGDGTFQPRVDYATGNSPVYVAAADFNSDGITDLAVANNGAPSSSNSGDSVTILLGQKNANGTANGTFAPGPTRDYPAGLAPTSLVVGDFNVDGLADLVVAAGDTASTGAAGDNAVSVLLGGGDGSFSSNFEIPVGTNPQSIVTGDFNDDSTLDIATANSGSDDVTVVLNSSSIFNGGTGANGSSGIPYPNVQYLDIGLKVKATPRIHADSEVTLALDFSISSVAGQSFNSIPVLSNQSITHTVRLKQDQTSVIANYLAPQTSVNVNGTPGIVGLPGLEWLAQNQSIADQNTEIIILVTPRMVRYAPRENREIYAGQGALEGPGAAPTPLPVQPAAPGEQQPGPAQPGAAQPVTPQPGPATTAPTGQQPPQQAPGQQAPQQPVGQPETPGQEQPNPNQTQPAPQPQSPGQTAPENPAPQTAPARPLIE